MLYSHRVNTCVLIMSENVALEKKAQKSFSKTIKKVKAKLGTGEVKVDEGPLQKKPPSTRGLIYIGHVPHGFYENEMRQYFSQFGKVTNLRLHRSRRTGKSKGFAYVEFKDVEVAKIVAETMDNYLMFKKRLEVKYVPVENRKPDMFTGTPWSENKFLTKIRREKYNKMKNTNWDDKQSQVIAARSLRKIEKKLQKLKELGIEHAFKITDIPPGLKQKENYHESEDEVVDSESDDQAGDTDEVVDSEPDDQDLLIPPKKLISKTKLNSLESNGHFIVTRVESKAKAEDKDEVVDSESDDQDLLIPPRKLRSTTKLDRLKSNVHINKMKAESKVKNLQAKAGDKAKKLKIIFKKTKVIKLKDKKQLFHIAAKDVLNNALVTLKKGSDFKSLGKKNKLL